MKQTSLFLLLALVASAGLLSFKPAIVTHKIDLNQSALKWTGYKVTGKHSGNVNLKSGELQFDGSTLVGGTFDIDMTSIACLEQNGSNDRLVGHLKSDDFFGVTNHPTANFKITAAKKQDQNTYKISGDLTIKGITKPINFNATVKDENGTKVADAFMKINRTQFDIKYRSGSFIENLGDKAINDEFDLQVKLITAK